MSAPLDRHQQGVFVVAPTPFHPDGAVDFDSIDRLADFYQSAGVDGLTVQGDLGEATKLDQDEAVAVLRRYLDRVSVPVVAGVSAPGFASMAGLTGKAIAAGAAAVMIAPPSTLRTDDQIVVMSVEVIRWIASEHPGCVMLKHEDWPGLDKITALRRLDATGAMPRLSILCGNGGLFLDFELERGADGAMTGYSYPEMTVAVVRLMREGRRDEAHRLFDQHLPFLRYEQQPGVGLAVRKYALMRRGLITSDFQRAPGSAPSPAAQKEVDYLLDRLPAPA